MLCYISVIASSVTPTELANKRKWSLRIPFWKRKRSLRISFWKRKCSLRISFWKRKCSLRISFWKTMIASLIAHQFNISKKTVMEWEAHAGLPLLVNYSDQWIDTDHHTGSGLSLLADYSDRWYRPPYRIWSPTTSRLFWSMIQTTIQDLVSHY